MLFEIHLARHIDPAKLLSEDVVENTRVKLMNYDEARSAGYARLPAPSDEHVRYLVASGRDAKFLHHVLENNPGVLSMRTYEVE